MSEFNKKNGELDFSNIKQTQLGSGNVMRASFSELQSGLRTLDTNAILKDAYTHFTQILNADDLPTKVEYWQATSPSKYEITCVRDISSNLLDTYIIFEEYISKRTILLYYDVDGNGTAPGIADEEYPVSIIENDSAFVVALSTFTVLKTLSDYFVVRSVGGALYTKVEVQFMQFGETSPINVGTTGFTSTQTKVGTSFKVGEVFLDYDVDGNTLYNGNKLKGLLYNPYTASFDVVNTMSQITSLTDIESNQTNGTQVTRIVDENGNAFRLTRENNDPDNGDIHDSIRLGNQESELTFTKNDSENKQAADVVTLNKLLDIPHDDIEITQFNLDGEPEIIEIKENGVLKRTLTLTYNAEGDFQRVIRT